jgi:tetratricopeptide (TPR) repeat protein
MYEQSVATRRHLTETDPRDVYAAGRLGAALWRLGGALQQAGRLQEALAATEEGIRVLDRALAQRQDMPIMLDLAIAEFYLGEIQEALHRPAAACAAWHRAEQRLPTSQTTPDLADVPYVRAELPKRLAACGYSAPTPR